MIRQLAVAILGRSHGEPQGISEPIGVSAYNVSGWISFATAATRVASSFSK